MGWCQGRRLIAVEFVVPPEVFFVSHQRLSLTEGLHAPAQARAWLAARLSAVSAQLVEDALLVVSELVTNAIRHGRPDIEVRLVTDPGRLRLEVHDGGEQLPVVPHGRPSVDRATGRGLLIVAATARDWGVVQGPDRAGKTVWAELAVDKPSTPAAGAGSDVEFS